MLGLPEAHLHRNVVDGVVRLLEQLLGALNAVVDDELDGAGTQLLLEELAEVMPLTPEEAMEIKGIGMVKARTVIPAMLKIIEIWKKEQKSDF